MAKRIFFMIPYPLKRAPSQRFRFEQYLDLLRDNGYELNFQSFLTDSDAQVFYGGGNVLGKALTLIKGFARRIASMFTLARYDYVFIHREASPIGPPIFEWATVHLLGRKVIYDFDDAIWLTDNVNESQLNRVIKNRSKVSKICGWAYHISCGNEYLAQYAAQFSSAVSINPTTIDTSLRHNRNSYPAPEPKNHLVIGWTGSHSTLKYLNHIESSLRVIQERFEDVRIVIIADKPPNLKLRSVVFRKWSEFSEVIDMLDFDVGIMPLPNDEWAKGKCGFKLLQYMALGIPSVCSPVGVNTSIVEHGVNGFLCSSELDWENAITRLLSDHELRKKMGEEGRNKVLKGYSIASNSSNFLSLFD